MSEDTEAVGASAQGEACPEGAEQEMIKIFIMDREYQVPKGLTIMKAMEFAGYKLLRACGCRAGFCGACSTIYRKADSYKLKFALACQTVAEDGMYLVQLPFVPANKAEYLIEKIEPSGSVILEFYPEIARCVACNTCSKACPQDIEVMRYIQQALRGDIEKSAQTSFDCIQCGLCTARCPADIKHYHVGQLTRRVFGRHLDARSQELKARVEEMQAGKYESELDRLMGLGEEEIKAEYTKRKIEAKGELEEEKKDEPPACDEAEKGGGQ